MRETDHPAGRVVKLRSRPMSAGQVLVVGAIAFVGAAFLNSQTLLDMAERQPYGWQRTIAVDLARPLHTVSQWTGSRSQARRSTRRGPQLRLGRLVRPC